MIAASEARDRAARYIAELEGPAGCELVLLDALTVERPSGWMFFYQSRGFVETGDALAALAGNAPVIVGRSSGDLVVAGTAHPPEYYFAQYEAQLLVGGA